MLTAVLGSSVNYPVLERWTGTVVYSREEFVRCVFAGGYSEYFDVPEDVQSRFPGI